MTRAALQAIGEIATQHPGAIAYEGASPSAIAASLEAHIKEVRASREIVEIYVKSTGKTIYEPLVSEHLLYGGAWAIATRDRTSDPRVSGLLMAKDEADAIQEVMTSLRPALDRLYFFAQDELTAQRIRACTDAQWAVEIPRPDVPITDGARQFLLERARADALAEEDRRPHWIVTVQGDEVYHDDLRAHIRFAQVERATGMSCQVATFFLHESQREGWDWQRPLDKRLTHYVWDFGEHAGFLDYPWIYYDPREHMRAHPHGAMFAATWSSARPVRKHYPFRSPEQALARIEDRLRVTADHPLGWQPHYENYRKLFFTDEDRPGGRELKHYHGWFPEVERAAGVW